MEEPISKRTDKVSLFADDSALAVTNLHTSIPQSKITINNYEKSTGGKLHDSKTNILLLGAARNKGITNKQLAVKFTVMADDEHEKYLGDIIGNTVTEEQRFKKAKESMKKIAKRWQIENPGIEGRVLIANTVMLA